MLTIPRYNFSRPFQSIFHANTSRLWINPEFKILWSIIYFITILMMNVFAFNKFSSEHFLHDKSVFKRPCYWFPFFGNTNPNITSRDFSPVRKCHDFSALKNTLNIALRTSIVHCAVAFAGLRSFASRKNASRLIRIFCVAPEHIASATQSAFNHRNWSFATLCQT